MGEKKFEPCPACKVEEVTLRYDKYERLGKEEILGKALSEMGFNPDKCYEPTITIFEKFGVKYIRYSQHHCVWCKPCMMANPSEAREE